MKKEIFKLCKQARDLWLIANPDGNPYSWNSLIFDYLKTYADSSCKEDEKAYQAICFCGIEVNPYLNQIQINFNTDLDSFKPLSFNLEKWVFCLGEALTLLNLNDKESIKRIQEKYSQKDFFDEVDNSKPASIEALFYEKYKVKSEILDDLLTREVNFKK